MAKKKKQELTSEELLAEALVREEDWPYKVPGNWVWVRLGSVTEVIMGQSPKGQDTTDDDSYIGLIGGAADMGEHYPKVSRYTMKPTKISQINDVIISIRATLGRPIISDGKYCLGRGVSSIRSKIITHKFILYYILNFENKFYEIATGTTFAQVSKVNLENMDFPLPPLAEQQRIVDRIGSLFDKLDQAKELIQEALDSFENRKAAILHQAFTGEFTKKWREAHGVGMESWEEKTLKEICRISSGGTPSRKINEYYKGNIAWIKTGEIKWNYLEDSEEKITEEAINNSSAKLFPAGTVLVAMYGQGLTRGRASILNIDATTNQAVCALIPSQAINNVFLYYYFMCNYWKFREMAFGGNQPNFSGTMIAEFEIMLPKLKEQQEIVRILDDLFEKEHAAKDLCDQIDQIDTVKKTILGKAFRGELGTNEVGDESARGLLKEVLK